MQSASHAQTGASIASWSINDLCFPLSFNLRFVWKFVNGIGKSGEVTFESKLKKGSCYQGEEVENKDEGKKTKKGGKERWNAKQTH